MEVKLARARPLSIANQRFSAELYVYKQQSYGVRGWSRHMFAFNCDVAIVHRRSVSRDDSDRVYAAVMESSMAHHNGNERRCDVDSRAEIVEKSAICFFLLFGQRLHALIGPNATCTLYLPSAKSIQFSIGQTHCVFYSIQLREWTRQNQNNS